MKELETAFEEVKGKPTPERYTRSQQEKMLLNGGAAPGGAETQGKLRSQLSFEYPYPYPYPYDNPSVVATENIHVHPFFGNVTHLFYRYLLIFTVIVIL